MTRASHSKKSAMPHVPFSVPHSLPVPEAAARLLAGVPKLEKALPPGGHVTAEQIGDDGMRLDIGVMGQTIVVDSQLTPEAVQGTIAVPMMLTMMKGQIVQMVESSVAKMLAKGAA